METSDFKLLSGIKDNRESAFDELFRKYYKNLTYFAIKIVKNRDTAEEIVQDLFVNFWEKRHILEPSISLKAYLFRAVYNNSIHYNKNEKRYEKTDVSLANDVSSEFDNLLENSELETKIYQLIGQLPQECRKIFKLSRFEELKYKEIADELNISIKTVETQMTRALKFLRFNLADYFKVLIFIILESRK